MKKPFFICLFISFILVLGLFHVKYKVRDLEHSLENIHTEIFREQETFHLLKAEWVFLNDPQRLDYLAKKHLREFGEASTLQLACMDSTPLPLLKKSKHLMVQVARRKP